jgi:hypothetical protein
MTWALFSTMEDMESIAAGFKETGLSGPLRNKLRNYWNGGLSSWQTAPCIPPEHPCYATDGVMSRPPRPIGTTPEGEVIYDEPTCMRMIVCSFGTVTDFRALLRELIGKNPEAGHYEWLEPYIASTGWYAVDPWPAPAGYFDGMVCL